MTSQTASYVAALKRAYAKTTEQAKRAELALKLRANGVDPDEPKAAERPPEPVPGRTEPVKQTAEKTTPDRPATRRGKPRRV